MNVRIPKKVKERLIRQVPPFQRVLEGARDRDVNESDTVTIVTDMLANVFGYDKYNEITQEYAIRRTFCDLAIAIEGKPKFLIEVKAIGIGLKQNHLRQAVNYGANNGVEWVILTNGIIWEVYRLSFERPIEHHLTCSLDFLALNSRKVEDQALLYILCREGLAKAAIQEFHEHSLIVNRFVLGSLIQSDPVLSVLRREIRRLSPEAQVTKEEIADLIKDVLKRDVLEGDDANRANARVSRSAKKPLRKRRARKEKESLVSSATGGDVESLDAD